jgi:uncharacterized protein
MSFVLGSVVELSLLALAVLIGMALGIPVLQQMRWVPAHALIGVVAILPPFVLFLWSLRSKHPWLVEHRAVVDHLVSSVFSHWSLMQLAVISLLAGLCEEALFRGALQGALLPHVGAIPAMLVAGLVFGLLHRITWIYALLATAIGVYFGALWLWTGNLLTPVLAHALYDFAALLWFLKLR